VGSAAARKPCIIPRLFSLRTSTVVAATCLQKFGVESIRAAGRPANCRLDARPRQKSGPRCFPSCWPLPLKGLEIYIVSNII
jgi:hypothetical protein